MEYGSYNLHTKCLQKFVEIMDRLCIHFVLHFAYIHQF